MATTDFCDGDYLGAYRRFLEHFVANICCEDQLPVKMSRRDVRECELAGDLADITLQHLNQRICPPSLQAYLVKLLREEFESMFQKQPEECGYRCQNKAFTPLKLMQVVTSKVNEICQRYLDNSRLALLPPPPSIPLPLVSSHAIKNRRRKMEDRSVVLHDLHTMFSIKNDAVVNYYAVFDGHGGQEAATYCAAHLHQYLLESPFYPNNMELALHDAFRTTDVRFLECDDTKNSGATAVCCLVYNKTLYIAWAGDSQAALIKNGRGVYLTVPHKPERLDEKSRIEDLGGEVVYFGTWRVNGVLNVSRSIGDSCFKPYVTEEPEVTKIELDGTEDFLIIACDGFWEKANEEIVASLLYEYVSSDRNNFYSASEALVLWARQNLSEDNISVIVVFLTAPSEIAAKHYYNPRPVAMEPHPDLESHHQAPYDFAGFGGPAKLSQPLRTNGNAEDGYAAAASLLEPINGRHRPKPPKYNDHDDDDEDDDDDDAMEEDLGPETNVDVVDESQQEFAKLDQAMGRNYPDEFLVKMPVKRDEEEDVAMDNEQRHESELIGETDNVADSEESEDEWNYYRPEDQQKKTAAVAAETAPDESSKPDRCEEEREACSPCKQPVIESTTSEENDYRPHSSGTDDVTAEFDEIHETESTEKEPATLLLDQQQLDDNDIEVEPEVTTTTTTTATVAAVVPAAAAATTAEVDLLPEEGKEQPQSPVQEPELFDDEDMESHLNPDAKEFVPSSPGSPPLVPQLAQMNSDLVAGSPLKQNQRALKNRAIPSEEEFQEEICRRPSEIGDESTDFSMCEASPNTTTNNTTTSTTTNNNTANLIGGFDDERQKTVLMNLDESEVSSTKAEFGDESTYSVASEFYKTGVDCSYTGSERGEFDAMATSMTPGDFKQAFEQEPDLNKVHELKDEDLLCTDALNGVDEEKLKIVVDEDELVNNVVEDFDIQQQNISVETFSAIVEERVSSYDNDDLFMNMRNTEQSKDELPSSTFSNPFTIVDDIQKLTEAIENINIAIEVDEKPVTEPVMMNPLDLNFGAAPVEQKVDEAILVSPVKEPEIMSSKFEEENLISRSTEALRDEIIKTESEEAAKEPSDDASSSESVEDKEESNYEEELRLLNEQLTETAKDNEANMEMQVEERDAKPINLSESLQEFTGLEEQLSPQSREVKDNVCSEEVTTLKESLVEEPKDVEEVAPIPAVEANDEPALSNETPEEVTALVDEIAATTLESAPLDVPTINDLLATSNKAPTPQKQPTTKNQPTKPTATSKVGTKASPTSPTKTNVAAKSTTTATKKAPLTAASKLRSTSTAASKLASSATSKTATTGKTATTAATKATTNATAKPAPRTSMAPAGPKPKLGNVTSKIGSLSSDKKPTTNGDVKSAAAKPMPSARTLSKPPTSNAAPKTRLVKSSTTSRTSIGTSGSATAPKPRPTSSTTTKTSVSSSVCTSSGASSVAQARPKTAPTTTSITSTAATKSKIGTKSPMIDKQIKETANKQISSARTSSLASAKPRQSTSKRMSLGPKPTASPAKKTLNTTATTKTAAKTNATSKVNSKVSSTTKTSIAAKAEVVQNGICDSDESKVTTTTTTTTTNIEEDVLMKDVSPIEQVTDNQLITAE